MDDGYDRRLEARHIAIYSLGQLLQKDSSVEAGVRAVLRVASLRNSSFWVAWAILQLTEVYDIEPGAGPLLEAQREIERILSDAEDRDAVLERARADFLETRLTMTGLPQYYMADVGELERDVPIFEAWLLMAHTDASRLRLFDQRDMRRTIVNRVKNKVQRYLMSVERSDDLGQP